VNINLNAEVLSKYFLFLAILLSPFIATSVSAEQHMNKRVPAEWEPQEAVWLQWPGRWEKVYEPAFAQIASIIHIPGYRVGPGYLVEIVIFP